jgi:L-fucose isomerase-like protein
VNIPFLIKSPHVLFWPLGNPELETAQDDAKKALENLKATGLDVTSIQKMTWWEPTEIPKLSKQVRSNDIDLVVVFSATHGTVRCISAIGKRFRKIPIVVWSIPIRYSLATSAIATSYLRERGQSVALFNNEASDASIRSELEVIARAARSYRLSKNLKIGIIGNLSPLMISLPYNLPLLKSRLGPSTRKISMQLLDKSLKSVGESEVNGLVSEYKRKFSVNVRDQILSKAVRFQLAVRKLVGKYGLDGIALECWTNLFSKYGVNPCLGHTDDLAVGCEGDVVSLSGSLILQKINGVNPYLADILSVDPGKNTIELSHCSAPLSLARDASKVRIGERTDPKSVGKTAFLNFDLKSGPSTLVRFYGRDLDKVHMTFGELESTGNYWGGISLIVKSGGSAKGFLDNASGNHYLFTYGDIRKEVRLFAKWRGLEVIEN